MCISQSISHFFFLSFLFCLLVNVFLPRIRTSGIHLSLPLYESKIGVIDDKFFIVGGEDVVNETNMFFFEKTSTSFEKKLEVSSLFVLFFLPFLKMFLS